MFTSNVHIIINPASAGGKTGKNISAICSAIKNYFKTKLSVCITKFPGEATISARTAIKEGCELIICAGGDGTIQEVVNGYFKNGSILENNCELGIINCGTGHGLAQTLGLPEKIEEQLEIINSGVTRKIDVGRVKYYDEENNARIRYFVNECQIGIGGAVVERVESKQKYFGGLIEFGLGAISCIFRHPNQEMTVHLDNEINISRPLVGLVIGNGCFTGGGMNLTPAAKLDDGQLDVLCINSQSVIQRLWNFPKIYFGKHLESDKFSYFKSKKIEIKSQEKVLIEADGELLGSLPCIIDLIPSAIRIKSNGNHKK